MSNLIKNNLRLYFYSLVTADLNVIIKLFKEDHFSHWRQLHVSTYLELNLNKLTWKNSLVY